MVSDGSNCIIIDPGFTDGELPALYDYLEAEGLTPTVILLTHSHPDHTLGLQPLVERFGIPVLPEGAESPSGAFSRIGLQSNAEKGAFRPFRQLKLFEVIETPGHTPDSVCYYNEAEHILFTGDTLFAGTIGRTDLPGGNYDDEIRSIMEKLIFLPGETVIYPGHGPQSSIARERIQNPFLEPFNEREEIDELN